MCAFTKKVPIRHSVGCICEFIQLTWCNTFGLVDWWQVKAHIQNESLMKKMRCIHK